MHSKQIRFSLKLQEAAPANIPGLATRDGKQYLGLVDQLFTLMLVTCLEGVPVTLAAAAPGIVAQGT